MTPALPEPDASSDAKALLLRYLDFFRETVVAKVCDLPDADLRSTRLPSGWTPIELVKHLACMERRWLVWGFLGEQVDDPWGDSRDGRWHVAAEESLDSVLDGLRQSGARTRAVVEAAALDSPATPGGRFPQGSEMPSMAAILFHVLQEYARHAGHLDVARELVDGRVGE